MRMLSFDEEYKKINGLTELIRMNFFAHQLYDMLISAQVELQVWKEKFIKEVERQHELNAALTKANEEVKHLAGIIRDWKY